MKRAGKPKGEVLLKKQRSKSKIRTYLKLFIYSEINLEKRPANSFLILYIDRPSVRVVINMSNIKYYFLATGSSFKSDTYKLLIGFSGPIYLLDTVEVSKPVS